MPTRYVLFWFDVEDCTVPQSDDAAKRLAQALTKHGVRGTMKVVGQKARVLRERIRYDVIDALAEHAIGYHSNWHGLRPQPAEYMAPFDWLEGGEEFAHREAPGLEDLRDLWHCDPVCYGQPGPNWSPQVFPILRRWGIPTYVSGFGYVGLFAQPFYYGGIVNTSHMYGRDRAGRQVQHMFGLNFELGEPGALAEHQRLFAASYENLPAGGLISIMNHPCTLVLREWFSTDLKPRELTDAGYEHFEAFVVHVLSHPDVRTVTADALPLLYPDRARGRHFSADELLGLARAVGQEVAFVEADDTALSAAEMFGMLARFLAETCETGAAPDGVVCEHLDGPASAAEDAVASADASADAFAGSVSDTARFLRTHGRLPDAVQVGRQRIALGSYYVALAEAARRAIEQRSLPDPIRFAPADNRVEGHVDEEAARGSWSGVMLRAGFSAPKLIEQARLQTWTLKPALLSGSPP